MKTYLAERRPISPVSVEHVRFLDTPRLDHRRTVNLQTNYTVIDHVRFSAQFRDTRRGRGNTHEPESCDRSSLVKKPERTHQHGLVQPTVQLTSVQIA